MKKKQAIGLMTGSSMDGIDAAILETDGLYHIKHGVGETVDFTPGFKQALRAAEYALQQTQGDTKGASENFSRYLSQFCSEGDKPSLMKSLDVRFWEQITFQAIIRKLTTLHAKLVKKLLSKAGIMACDIAVIGFHGQNLYHKPTVKTVQIGDGQLLADQTGIAVLNNFRENDVKSGGQGAPFAPLYHFALANAQNFTPVALINCGGITNITLIYDSNPGTMIAYDTGPGNVLIDRYIRKVTHNRQHMDRDGLYGLKGTVAHALLPRLREQAIQHDSGDFLSKSPPKSLDSRHFKLIDELDKLSIEDACATLEYFTADCIVSSLDLIPTPSPNNFVLAGGGWKNPVIYTFLKQLLREKLGDACQIYSADERGWSSQYMEAEIFAYLAVRNLAKLPISLPNITGAAHPTLSDNLYFPSSL